jgi:DNA-binding LacI/PurR family transcriptional regulator
MDNFNTSLREKKGLGPVADRIRRELAESLSLGSLKTGSRLPTEAELCARFNASRTTVRAALAGLAEEGRILKRKGSGVYAAPPPPSDSKSIALMFHGDMKTLVDAQNLILERDMTMTLFSQMESGWSPALEARFLRGVLESKPRALIANCTPVAPVNESLVGEIAAAGTRVIHIEPYQSGGLPGESYLMPDYFQAGRAMAVALMIAGYKRIFYLSVSGYEAPFHVLSRAGFASALSEQRGGESREIDFDGDDVRGNIIRKEAVLSDPSLIKRMLAASGGSVGVACPTRNNVDRVLRAAKGAAAAPQELGIVALNVGGDFSGGRIAHVTFDKLEILKNAVSLAAARDFNDVRKLVQPVLVKGASCAENPL